MKRMMVSAALIFSGVALWRLGSLLSADAIGLAVGVLLGMLAGIPVSLLVLVSSRRREERGRAAGRPLRQPAAAGGAGLRPGLPHR